MYTITKRRRSSKPPPMLLMWRWICYYPARPENAGESAYHQFKNRNLRQHHSHQ